MSTRQTHNPDEVQTLLDAHFKYAWAQRSKVKYANMPQPAGLVDEDYWVAYMVEFGDSWVNAVGGCKEYRTSGRVVLDFNFKKNKGSSSFPKRLVDSNKIFRGENISGIRMGSPLVSPEIGDDSYYRKVVSYPFNFDDK